MLRAVTSLDAALLAGAGLVAGIVNALAGGGSFLTVPLMVLLGIPGNLANGTNRVGILAQNAVASWRFGAEGVPGWRDALPLLPPIALGSLLGAWGISHVSDAAFERTFAVLMLALLVPMLRNPIPAPGSVRAAPRWSPALRFAVFFGIGVYGGAFQGGVGIPLVFALSYAGYDLVLANSIKVVVIGVLVAVAVPVFAVQGLVAWAPAAALSVGFLAGGGLGARITVRGGERVIRPVLAVCVLALAGHMLGLY
jgi:uncharacterized protein